MDAKPLSIGKIVSERQRFIVPIYQRTYAWNQRELEPLVEQIEGKADELLKTGKVAFSHYMGALLLIPDSDPVFGKIQAFNVVDGQQRLTTFHLCFAALRDVAKEFGFPDVARQLSDLIVHSDDTPMQDRATERYKLEPTTYDRALFRHIIDLDRATLRQKYPDHFFKNGKIRNTAPGPLWAYWYFWDQAEDYITEGRRLPDRKEYDHAVLHQRLLALSTVLFEHFRLIVITLAADDDAQVIFETLNSGGKPLAAMDLVRNDVFHRANRRNEDQGALLEEHWSEFEQPFWKQEQTQGRIKKPRIDFFLGHVLAAERGVVISLGELFSEYKAFVAARAFESTAAELGALTKYAPAYRQLAEPSVTGELSKLSRRLNTFDLSTAYPLVLVIAQSDADDATKARLYDLVGSYIVRRAICYLSPKNYNNLFVEVAAFMKKNGITEDAFATVMDAKKGADTSRFPTDDEFAAAIRSRPQYGWIPQHRLKLILEELEFAMRDKFNIHGTLQDGLTIEHVMPQTWTTNWPLPSGAVVPADFISGVDEAVRLEIEARKAVVQTLPNLTLLTPPANSSASNSDFETKRVRLHDSLLKTNIAIAAEPVWNEQAIARRADVMAAAAIALWPSPSTPTANADG
ncbi:MULTISPECIES: DUF262 domain-containing protein [unclassified Caulobacter]|uniref:DUF262 domain-containing protein n=1 Tax=unclassified Caulobacter TaxID=2648921 RepID=UPI000D378111|nr:MULTISPECIES: DUF262 domain-containing protein [unclassified Caulobacter]PTS91326.1 hypothetical protein DBR21_01525 [Caulobacter sp. HMWF009]PTT04993.1 hypothetical protein DBR10_17125 [Caulobacter sp. HMWF025]